MLTYARVCDVTHHSQMKRKSEDGGAKDVSLEKKPCRTSHDTSKRFVDDGCYIWSFSHCFRCLSVDAFNVRVHSPGVAFLSWGSILQLVAVRPILVAELITRSVRLHVHVKAQANRRTPF